MNAIDHFDRLYRQDDDPWRVRHRWYEQRKQALLLASLPRARYACAFEPACGTGALTQALAGRCDEVLASDGAMGAVNIARQATSNLAHVRVDRLTLPQEWPTGRKFDLIILSEWLYYLPQADLQATVRCCRAGLSPGGTVLACHWRPDFKDRVQSTESVHAALQTGLSWPRVFKHEERDFLMEAWTPSQKSVAQEEGFA